MGLAGLSIRCRCGHDRVAHEHYRAGSDCALCECSRLRLRLARSAASIERLRSRPPVSGEERGATETG